MTQIADSSGTGAPPPSWSSSIESLARRFAEEGRIPSGVVVDDVLGKHPPYLDERIGWSDEVPRLGTVRTVDEHLAVVAQRWDPARAPKLSGRHVVLALALDEAALGWSLLQSGVIGSMLGLWTPGLGTAEEPHRLVWDVLSDEGRRLADEQPLLAAALGAPAEWTVEAPGPVTAVALSADSARMAVLVGSTVHEAGGGQDPRALGDVGDGAVSLGWSGRGPVALRIRERAAEVVLVATGAPLGAAATDVTGGQLSGDGSCAWLERAGTVLRWTPPRNPEPGTSTGSVLAVDGPGGRALVGTGSEAVLVSGLVDGPLPGSVEGQPRDPPGSAPAIGWGSLRGGPSAVVTLGRRPALVAISAGRVVVEHLPFPPVASLATGADPVTGLYVDPTGTRLAVVQGESVGVWTVTASRATSTVVPGFSADDTDTDDLLGADDDARALAALIASTELRPPLAVGLFGDWGAGKSFVLGRLTSALAAFTGPDAADGYLHHVPVVEFNAWHYAETDLWASLVERIRQVLLDLSPGTTPEGAEAERRADEARSEGAATAAQLASASDAVEQARRRLRQQRIRAAVVAGLVVVMAVSVGVAVLLGAGAKVVAVATFLAAAFGVVQQTLRARREVAGAGAEVRSTLAHLVGQPEKVAVQEAEERRRHLADEARQLADEAARMKQEADAARERAERNPVGTQIAQLRTVTEYQARLGPIAHTRELFKKIDDAVRASRQRRQRGEQGDDETRLDRVVITIDDLDRCPPEKVVKVLEAVHLMCSFEMFVVLVAVDTRWLDQSLRIRYRELLGRKGTAAPKDYVEKIIQVPIQIPALGETQVQAMIAGLTGQAVVATTQEEDEAGDAPEHEGGGGGPVGEALEAERPRPPRPPLPAEVLMVGPEEAPALARVAPIVGTTPRTVKRFVNTYKLIKARSKDPSRFGDRDGGGLHDDEIVSFLLAVNTGHATLAQRLFGALVAAGESETLASVVKGLDADPGADPSAALIGKWLEDHATYADASVTALARWVPEVARFSFVSPDRLPPAGG